MIARLFRWWLSKLKRFEIGSGSGHQDDVFFVRYDLIKTRWGSVYLHEFLRSDADRCLHDHPWPFMTIILRGGYWEELPAAIHRDPKTGEARPLVFYGPLMTREWRRPGYIGRYPAEHAHRIELDPARPKPWSLVIVGRKRRAWGFWNLAGKWRPWKADESNPICETTSAEARP